MMQKFTVQSHVFNQNLFKTNHLKSFTKVRLRTNSFLLVCWGGWIHRPQKRSAKTIKCGCVKVASLVSCVSVLFQTKKQCNKRGVLACCRKDGKERSHRRHFYTSYRQTGNFKLPLFQMSFSQLLFSSVHEVLLLIPSEQRAQSMSFQPCEKAVFLSFQLWHGRLLNASLFCSSSAKFWFKSRIIQAKTGLVKMKFCGGMTMIARGQFCMNIDVSALVALWTEHRVCCIFLQSPSRWICT